MIDFSSSVLIFAAFAMVAGILFAFVYRAAMKTFASKKPHGAVRNIGTNDRVVRLVVGIALLVWAMLTGWSWWLVFFSGFCFFEAAFSWCGMYAALGKNTCPMR